MRPRPGAGGGDDGVDGCGHAPFRLKATLLPRFGLQGKAAIDIPLLQDRQHRVGGQYSTRPEGMNANITGIAICMIMTSSAGRIAHLRIELK